MDKTTSAALTPACYARFDFTPARPRPECVTPPARARNASRRLPALGIRHARSPGRSRAGVTVSTTYDDLNVASFPSVRTIGYPGILASILNIV